MGIAKFLIILSFVFGLPFVAFPVAGDLDPTFDSDGKVTTDVGSGDCCAEAVVVQPDGKIIAAGSEGGIFALVRYNTDGSLDTSFDGDGILITDFSPLAAAATSVAVQSDGKIIAAGIIYGSNNGDFVLVRYNPNGSLDFTFDGDGIVTTDFASGADYAGAVVVQPDGRIVAAGGAIIGSNSELAIARYNPDGSLDSTFDGDGKVTTDYASGTDTAYAVAVQSDGKIIAAGGTVMVRYNNNGSLDSSFDGDGKVSIDFGSITNNAQDLTLQPDGKIIVAGEASDNVTSDFALARYNVNGSLDFSFDQDGIVTTDFASGADYASAVVVLPNGKIVVGGGARIGSDRDFAVARYDTNGILDFSFNGDGKVTTDFGSVDDGAMDLSLQPDGKIIAAGGGDIGNNHVFAVSRYQPDQCLFCDDFEDGVLSTEWAYVKPLWNEVGGNLIGSPSQRKAEAVAIPVFLGCSVCSVQATMSSNGGLGNRVWLLAWYGNKQNTIEVLMKEENDKWIIKQRSNGTVVAKAKGLAVINSDVFYNVVVAFDGVNFTLAVDGVSLATMRAATIPNGTVGFRAKNTAGTFGLISVF